MIWWVAIPGRLAPTLTSLRGRKHLILSHALVMFMLMHLLAPFSELKRHVHRRIAFTPILLLMPGLHRHLPGTGKTCLQRRVSVPLPL